MALAYEPFVKRWTHAVSSRAPEQKHDFPSYYVDSADASDTSLAGLATECVPTEFQLGTGAKVYTSAILPALLSARREVLLVTCFWAKGRILDALADTIKELARRRIAEGAIGEKLRLRIGLSSVSIFQRLFHTSRTEGYVYPASKWEKLGLPSSELMEKAGIDLQVKSLFFNPISVLHPKFVVVDRTLAFLPSANVSWEPWLEGCLVVTGKVVDRLLTFHHEVWEKGDHSPPYGETSRESAFSRDAAMEDYATRARLPVVENTSIPDACTIRFAQLDVVDSPSNVSTLLLPSPHHRNPRFRPFPWQKPPEPPTTPLNAAILHLLSSAQRSVYLQSPNFTCPAVLGAILAALDRGVDVRIVAGGKKMMLLEQLVTAGTTTGSSLKKLIKSYRALEQQRSPRGKHPHGNKAARNPAQTDGSAAEIVDVEPGIPALGTLQIAYFAPPPAAGGAAPTSANNVASAATRDPSTTSQGGRKVQTEEPTHAHLKLTVVDGCVTVLGSGNMDRASFFTSQELGILLYSPVVAAEVMRAVQAALERKVEETFPVAHPSP